MDGIIIINKTKNCTSHDIVRKARKILNEKVGHTGTLDPNATGVLPLLIGQGTLLSKYLINHDKTYIAVLQLGEKRDTADVEGNIIETQEVQEKYLDETNIKKCLEELKGEQEQIPPMYSAIKINGKKLYEYARAGKQIELKPRKINIYNLELLHIDKKNKTIEFKIDCSKGTYIRTVCEKIAEKLHTVGFMKELERIKVGKFSIEHSITIEELENMITEKLKNNTVNDNQVFINVEKFFKNKPSIKLDEKKLTLFLNGVKLSYNLEDGIYKIYSNDKFIGTGTIEKHLLKRDIII